MTEDHEQDKPEVADDLNPTHTSDDGLLFHVTQLATTRKDRVTFWSLPREIRDLIWNEVLDSEDDIFQANVTRSVCDTELWGDAWSHANRYEEVRFKRREDGRFNKITRAPILLSSRPPLPLAHLCQESRGFVLQKYDAAYRKARHPDLNQERGGRFRWLSRSTPRLLSINIGNRDYDEADMKVPLGDHEPLILLCHRNNRRSWESTRNNLKKQTALLELLKKAQDYQIMICWNHGDRVTEEFLVDRNIAQNWGVFADRAPGQDFPQERDTQPQAGIFVELPDIFPMVQLLRDINRRGRTFDMRRLGLRTRRPPLELLAPFMWRGQVPYFTRDGFRRLEEEEFFPGGDFVTELKDRELVQEIFAQYLKPFEELWEENVNEEDTSSQSRYGRMPKIGLVFKHNAGLTWADVQEHYLDGSEDMD
ncbi:hypothetical protein QBC32DRAFT_376885 [Pseudoneurospora amorphoporcata]|uniref:2EXR domain-containing protein n=1 Tax=Pseudoneurospora amorphoporcata TaxID=241081 RepID=A0AAN6SEN0_9PEZI|nr:hypothetical protein QBC32DRAFT_376885 [Pseudoneurospora amorphoporcata]